ncbi:MAG: hypothetical protein LBB51_06645, partial [Zoogloeaceae bacterium]|nr:hypothetical protein [Zoogloeaceae bacterium]
METSPADSPTKSNLPAGIRARFWCAPERLGVEDADPRLWLHLADGRVLAIRWYRGRFQDDALLPALFSALEDDARGLCHELSLPGLGKIQLLYAAPVIPAPIRQGVFSESLRREVGAFSRYLDREVLDFLVSLGGQRFFASVRNYNRLATLEPELRQRRLQALCRFPALVVPILLTQHHSPNLCDGKRHAWRLPAPEVEAAIDAGRDLTGALAAHYAISRGLVRAPLNRLFWEAGDEKQRALLHFFDLLPANKRPDAETLLQDWSLLSAYCFLFRRDAGSMDVAGAGLVSSELLAAAHVRAFQNGWEATWDICRQRAENPRAVLVDCRDFLTAAGRRAAEFLNRRSAVPVPLLAAGWLAEFGLANLLDASRRWHQRQPAATSVKAATLDFHLPALIGEVTEEGGRARELLTAAELAQEGAQMQHCVGSYWEYCLDGDRIFALATPAGARATAQYKGSA